MWGHEDVAGRGPTSQDLWLYRTIPLTVTVREQGQTSPPSLEGLRIDIQALGIDGYGSWDLPSPEPWDPCWLTNHGLNDCAAVPLPGTVNTFESLVPRIDGIALRVSGPGWLTAVSRVPVHPGAESAQVTLELARSHRIAGILRDESGVPVGDATVEAHVSLRGSYDKVNLQELFCMIGAPAIARCNRQESAVVANARVRSATDEEGRFHLELAWEGDVLLVAYVEGFRPLRERLGQVAADREALALTLRRPIREERVTLVHEGRDLANLSLDLLDCSSWYVRTGATTSLDGAGQLSTTWLEAGRRYWIHVFSENGGDVAKGQLEWNGQSILDLATLRQEPD